MKNEIWHKMSVDGTKRVSVAQNGCRLAQNECHLVTFGVSVPNHPDGADCKPCDVMGSNGKLCSGNGKCKGKTLAKIGEQFHE